MFLYISRLFLLLFPLGMSYFFLMCMCSHSPVSFIPLNLLLFIISYLFFLPLILYISALLEPIISLPICRAIVQELTIYIGISRVKWKILPNCRCGAQLDAKPSNQDSEGLTFPSILLPSCLFVSV